MWEGMVRSDSGVEGMVESDGGGVVLTIHII